MTLCHAHKEDTNAATQSSFGRLVGLPRIENKIIIDTVVKQIYAENQEINLIFIKLTLGFNI